MQPQRRGVVDAYVVAVGLDSDPVFGREAREAGRVLTRRYGAAGRSVTLAGRTEPRNHHCRWAPRQSGRRPRPRRRADGQAGGRPDLYTTSHGAPFGIVYSDADQGFGAISPTRLWTTLSTLGVRNRLLFISACYAGIFVPLLASDTTAILKPPRRPTARPFGCQADQDWTFFGDATINHALRKPQPFAAAAARRER